MNIQTTGTRALMLGFWMIALSFFLYSPLLLRWFSAANTMNILIWPAMLDVEKLARFEKKTGTRVYISYYESNDELVRKLRMTRADGYDLIIASDSTIDALRSENIFAKIDKSMLPFIKNIRSSLLYHYFDPQSEFSIPYYCGIYGLGINKEYFGAQLPKPTWDLLFKQHEFKVTMSDDPRKAILLAGRYLYGSIDDLATEQKIAAIGSILTQQKKWVELYSDTRGEEVLAAGSCPVALTLSSDLWRIAREYSDLQFLVPEEGSFMIIDSFVIPATSHKKDLAYQLLNYIYEPSMIRYHALKYGFCPPLENVSIEHEGIVCPTDEQMEKLDFFRAVLPKNIIDSVWLSVMAQ